MNIPIEIEKAIKTRQLILFVGAGYSCSPPLSLPNWQELILFFIDQIKRSDSSEYLDALEKALSTRVVDEIYALDILSKKGYRQKCIDLLKEKIDIDFTGLDLTKFIKLWQISDKIITTNYDCVLENSLPDVLSFTYTDKSKVAKLYNTERYLFKIHGTIKNPEECVLFKDTYENLYKDNKLAIKELSDIFSHKTILFIGFGLTDPYITDILSELQSLYEGNKGKHYVLTTKNEDFSKFDVDIIKLPGWHELDVYLDTLVKFREQIDFSFEELIKNLKAKGKEYDIDELREKHEKYLNELYGQPNNKELTTFVESGQFNKAEDLLLKGFEDKLSKISIEKKEAAENAYNLAVLKQLQLEYREALFYIQKAHELNSESIVYLRVLCELLLDSGNYALVKIKIDEALKIPNLGDVDEMYFKSRLGNYYFETGDYNTSLQVESEVIKLSQNIFGADNAETIAINNSIGASLRNLGRYRDAISIYEQGINQLTKLKPTYPLKDLALFYNNLSAAWASIAWDNRNDKSGKIYYEKSLWYAEESLRITIEISKDPNKSVRAAIAYNHAGIAIKRLGDIKKGIVYYNKALDIIRNTYSEDHPRYIDFSFSLSAALRANEQEKEAIEMLLDIIIKSKKFYGDQHKKVGGMYINLGFAYASVNDFINAVLSYEKGLTIMAKYLRPDHPTMQNFLYDYYKFKALASKNE